MVATGSAILAFSAALLNIVGEHTPAQATPSEQPTVVVQVVDPNHHITVEQKGSSLGRGRPSAVWRYERGRLSEVWRYEDAVSHEEASSQEKSIYLMKGGQPVEMSVKEALSYYNDTAGQTYDPTHPTKVTVTLEEMAAAANLKPEEMAAVIEQITLQDSR